MSVCSSCGREMTPGDHFCANCGTPQDTAEAQVQQGTEPRPVTAAAYFHGLRAGTGTAQPAPAAPSRPQTAAGAPAQPVPEAAQERYAPPRQPTAGFVLGQSSPTDGPSATGPVPPTAGDIAGGIPAPAGSGQAAKATIRRWEPTLGQAVVMASGILVFIWSFLDWYSADGIGANAWSTITFPGLVLTATWVPLLSLAIAVLVAIKATGGRLPDRVAGFSWAQLALVVGLFDVLITFGYLVANRTVGVGLAAGTVDLGAGLILSFITSLTLLVGAILDQAGVGVDIFSSNDQKGQDQQPGP